MQTHGGVSRCFAELYRHQPDDCHIDISLLESNNAYLKEIGVGKPVGYNYQHFILPFHWPYKGKMFTAYNMMKGRGRTYHWNMYEYNKAETIQRLKKGKFDVFHPTFFDDYFLPHLNGKPFVLTIHDMIPELYPQYFARDDFQIEKKKILAPKAAAIVAVSETTKKDIVRLLNVPEEKVYVVYHGVSFPRNLNVIKLYEFPYMLYVGDRYGYKNFDLFVRYVAPVLERHEELKLVCTGKPFTLKEQQMLEELGIKDRCIHHWVTSDEEFFSLYHNAVCFVYSSEYEGFGIPILEAYQADCPVMLNRASCFPEIAGEAAIYFDMTKEQSNFSEKFEHLYSEGEEHRELLLQKQRERLKNYSWEKSAQQMKKIYSSVV